MLDPTRDGLWLITTMSGAQYWIDARHPDLRPTLTRLPAASGPCAGYTQVALRRDEEPLALICVHHRTPMGRLAAGLVVGAEAIFTIEPLVPDADVTFRRTTSIRSVHRLDPVRPATRRARGTLEWATVPELLDARGANVWTSVSDVAAAVSTELAGEADHIFALLILAKGIERWRALGDRASEARWFAHPPAPTGDPRFDTLIAGVVQHLAVERDHRAPAWADAATPLPRPWFPFGLHEPSPAHTWHELDALNIVLDAYFTEVS